jgi:hypothetical protein
VCRAATIDLWLRTRYRQVGQAAKAQSIVLELCSRRACALVLGYTDLYLAGLFYGNIDAHVYDCSSVYLVVGIICCTEPGLSIYISELCQTQIM